MIPAEWVRAELPGSPLVLTVDAGGERWRCNGRPLHGGDRLDLLTEGESRWCDPCHGEGCTVEGEAYRPHATGGRCTCPDCGGRGYTFAPVWVAVRFEYRNAGDGTGEALLYVRAAGGGRKDHHAIRVRNGDSLRFRLRQYSAPELAP